MSEYPHMAHIGSDAPECICTPPPSEQHFDDPSTHKNVCPFGEWLRGQVAPLEQPGKIVEADPYREVGMDQPQLREPVAGACPCTAILAREAEGFQQEASGYPAGSPEKKALLMHAEFLLQLASQITVRKLILSSGG